jgi:hypothetical protein
MELGAISGSLRPWNVSSYGGAGGYSLRVERSDGIMDPADPKDPDNPMSQAEEVTIGGADENGAAEAEGTQKHHRRKTMEDLLNPEKAKEDEEKPLTPEEALKELTGRKSTPEECETCKRRKYQDGSDEMVSFKAAGHIDPNNAASVVLGHEQEHVSNAYQKAKAHNGKVLRASVQLKTAICPECGRTYIAGGVTNTQILYYNEDNPYQQDKKESDADNQLRGMNIDIPA